MCRLLGIISKEKISPYKYIIKEKFSLIKQAIKENQKDGWGLGYYEKNKLMFLVRKTEAIYKSKEIEEVSKSIKSDLILAFVRKASNPRNLKKEKLLTLDATQPFSYENLLFMHNGAIYIPDEVLRELNYEKIKPRSLNDSEVYFITFLKFLEEKNNIYKALKETENFILKVFNEINNKKIPFSSLNVIISDGYKIYAYNRYIKKDKISLINKNREYYKMCFLNKEKEFIISSEPLNEENWKDLGNNKFLEVWKEEEIKYKII